MLQPDGRVWKAALEKEFGVKEGTTLESIVGRGVSWDWKRVFLLALWTLFCTWTGESTVLQSYESPFPPLCCIYVSDLTPLEPMRSLDSHVIESFVDDALSCLVIRCNYDGVEVSEGSDIQCIFEVLVSENGTRYLQGEVGVEHLTVLDNPEKELNFNIWTFPRLYRMPSVWPARLSFGMKRDVEIVVRFSTVSIVTGVVCLQPRICDNPVRDFVVYLGTKESELGTLTNYGRRDDGSLLFPSSADPPYAIVDLERELFTGIRVSAPPVIASFAKIQLLSQFNEHELPYDDINFDLESFMFCGVPFCVSTFGSSSCKKRADVELDSSLYIGILE